MYVYTHLYTHTSANRHTHTYLHKSLKRIQMFSLSLKGHLLLQNYIQHYYDLPSAISNFCYTYAGCYKNHELINYTVILKANEVIQFNMPLKIINSACVEEKNSKFREVSIFFPFPYSSCR